MVTLSLQCQLLNSVIYGRKPSPYIKVEDVEAELKRPSKKKLGVKVMWTSLAVNLLFAHDIDIFSKRWRKIWASITTLTTNGSTLS